METKVKPQKYVAPSSPDGSEVLESSNPENLPMLPPANTIYDQWRQIGAETSTFLAQLPKYIAGFFQASKLPIISVALILTAIVALRVVLAVVDALNDIPLLAPTFELIGISYITWLIFRYLLKAETRQELADKIQRLKDQTVGENPSDVLS